MEQAFEYYKIDESAAEKVQQYRKQNPGDNLMTRITSYNVCYTKLLREQYHRTC